MLADGKSIGTICLARTERRPYTVDEIARLGLVADEIAAFTTRDHRRQMTIAFTERQRLVRDLHDSVTQRLYGLLTLTEASQAAAEAGTAAMPAELLSQIGENTRQALKEMRLFLYGLQPVDLEHEGLISVLHQRLAAVEGRADVKARLLADDEINLSLTKEVALYFIAQEALNNVLRHANAKSVTLRLKQTQANVLLSIEDDGCGFDPGQQGNEGMGLNNIRERVAQIEGRLRIVSSPGNGTKVFVSVGKEIYPNTIQERGD
jgi:signal transduction histidine kinase